MSDAVKRETFDQETFRRCEAFARELLRDVPELEGLAIFPSWLIPQDRLAPGILTGRQGPLRSPQELVHMAEQLYAGLRTLLTNAHQLIHHLDQRMGEMAEEIRAREQRLAELDQQLAAQGEPPLPVLDPASGTFAGDPGVQPEP